MNKGVLTAIVIAVLVATGLILAPHSPEETPAQAESHDHVKGEVTELDLKVNEAVAIIQSGTGSPMAAIATLQEVVEEDSTHVGAQYWLGEFSIMSQQFDKAESRFKTVLNLDPSNANALYKLVQAQVSLNKDKEAVEAVETFIAGNQDHPEIEKVQEVLDRLKG